MLDLSLLSQPQECDSVINQLNKQKSDLTFQQLRCSRRLKNDLLKKEKYELQLQKKQLDKQIAITVIDSLDPSQHAEVIHKYELMRDKADIVCRELSIRLQKYNTVDLIKLQFKIQSLEKRIASLVADIDSVILYKASLLQVKRFQKVNTASKVQQPTQVLSTKVVPSKKVPLKVAQLGKLKEGAMERIYILPVILYSHFNQRATG